MTSIDSIITQLPNLTSLNLSDCPNVRTLLPLASVVSIENDATTNDEHDDDDDDSRHHPRLLALKHLYVRGCNLNTMSNEEWASVFDALAESTGPLERLTLSRNNMSYLHGNIGKLTNLTYLFVEETILLAVVVVIVVLQRTTMMDVVVAAAIMALSFQKRLVHCNNCALHPYAVTTSQDFLDKWPI